MDSELSAFKRFTDELPEQEETMPVLFIDHDIVKDFLIGQILNIL